MLNWTRRGMGALGRPGAGVYNVGMDENPYKAPADSGEIMPTEPENLWDLLRSLAIGPRMGVAWGFLLAGTVAIIVGLKLLGRIAF